MTLMMKCSIVAAATLPLALAGPALASSSDWFSTDGADIRLITAGAPDADGKLKGVLDIVLKPGWKTYWQEPGDAGVPPVISMAEGSTLRDPVMGFPAPQRHDEGDFKWAGYDHSVAFPLTFTVKQPGAPATIDADVFIGICETICVPLKAKLTLDPTSDPENVDDVAAIEAAFAALPPPAREDFGVKVVSGPGDTSVVLEAAFPGDPASAELFIAGQDGYSFTTPERVEKDGKTFFTTEVSLPAKLGAGDGLPYTLVTAAGAVSGFLPYF